jgi:uncharacterized protein DUF5615
MREVDVLTAQDDRAARLDDPDLLDRATALGRALVTHDRHFLVEAQRRQVAGEDFGGLVFARHRTMSHAEYIGDLELIAKTTGTGEMTNRVVYLPI